MQVVETDLGEYIIQLADEPPSHIIAPAIHKTRGQVAELFTAELGIPPTDDIAQLTAPRAQRCAIVSRLRTSVSVASTSPSRKRERSSSSRMKATFV